MDGWWWRSISVTTPNSLFFLPPFFCFVFFLSRMYRTLYICKVLTRPPYICQCLNTGPRSPVSKNVLVSAFVSFPLFGTLWFGALYLCICRRSLIHATLGEKKYSVEGFPFGFSFFVLNSSSMFVQRNISILFIHTSPLRNLDRKPAWTH